MRHRRHLLTLSLSLAVSTVILGSLPATHAQEISTLPPMNPNVLLEEISGNDDNISDEAFTTDQLDNLMDPYNSSSTYTLGVNDIIEINVLRHPEVSGQFVINNEGNIQYEFIGDFSIEGLTKKELKTSLVEHLSEYIISPEVTIKIVGYNSKIVYVVGEVARPGKIFMRGDTITVREALVQAGLPLLSAKPQKSSLITPSSDGTPETKSVNAYKLLYKGDLRQNLVMKPGDTLYIPPTILAKTMRIMQPIAAPIGTASSTGRTVMTGF